MFRGTHPLVAEFRCDTSDVLLCLSVSYSKGGTCSSVGGKEKEGKIKERRSFIQVRSHVSCYFLRSAGDSERLHSRTGREKERERREEGTETTANSPRGEKIEKQRHCRTNSSLTSGGRRLAGKLKWQQTQRESEKVHMEKRDSWSHSQTPNNREESSSRSRQAAWERRRQVLDFSGDAFRLWGHEERRGQTGGQHEARCRSGVGDEDAVRLLLSRFVCTCRGEVHDDGAVMPQVGPHPGTCFNPACRQSNKIWILLLANMKMQMTFLDVTDHFMLGLVWENCGFRSYICSSMNYYDICMIFIGIFIHGPHSWTLMYLMWHIDTNISFSQRKNPVFGLTTFVYMH